MRTFVVGFCTLVAAESSFILPELTGKTMITKMQVAAIIIGALGVAATTVKALLTPTKGE